MNHAKKKGRVNPRKKSWLLLMGALAEDVIDMVERAGEGGGTERGLTEK